MKILKLILKFLAILHIASCSNIDYVNSYESVSNSISRPEGFDALDTNELCAFLGKGNTAVVPILVSRGAGCKQLLDYLHGLNVINNNDDTALEKLKLSASQGGVASQNQLGIYFYNKKRQYIKAYIWFSLAANKGWELAEINRDNAARKLSPQELLQAKNMAQECERSKFKNCNDEFNQIEVSNDLKIQAQPSQLIIQQSVGKRLALVIGNSSYKLRPLNNPHNDADDVSKVLKSTGFEVIDLRDATLAQMRVATRQFGEKLMTKDVGLVYYSGHGIEVKGKNYLIPVNADINHTDEIADQALDVSLILAKMDSAKKGANILIIDACRDDPFGRSFRSSSRGLASMDAPEGTIIAYATAPGMVADDGNGRNSPYTKNLVKAMQMPNIPIELMFKEVRKAVREETKGKQTPWENTSLSGDFYFQVKK